MKKNLLNILLLTVLLTLSSCASKSYYVKNGKLHPYNSRGLASEKVKIKYKNAYYYFDTVQEAEHFQGKIQSHRKLKSTITSPAN